jgi:hypothetical protein
MSGLVKAIRYIIIKNHKPSLMWGFSFAGDKTTVSYFCNNLLYFNILSCSICTVPVLEVHLPFQIHR